MLLLHTCHAVLTYLIYTLGVDMSYEHFKSLTIDVICLRYVTLFIPIYPAVIGVYVLFLKCCINTIVKHISWGVAVMSQSRIIISSVAIMSLSSIIYPVTITFYYSRCSRFVLLGIMLPVSSCFVLLGIETKK